ncbi:MAG: hypothetical protein IPH54_20720 [Rhodoferax sp.]|nr:hypothetical protein [Rhodoferax sp.]
MALALWLRAVQPQIEIGLGDRRALKNQVSGEKDRGDHHGPHQGHHGDNQADHRKVGRIGETIWSATDKATPNIKQLMQNRICRGQSENFVVFKERW